MTRDRRWAIASLAAGILLIGLLLGIASGLVGSMAPEQGDGMDLATSELAPGMACDGALLEGDLVKHPAWVVALDLAEPRLIFWPKGYSGRARGDEIEILNPEGEVVARTGERITAGGGGGTIDGVGGFVMCPHGPTVIAPAGPPAAADAYELTCDRVPDAECEVRAAAFAADFRAAPPPARIVPPGTEIVSISVSPHTLDARLSNGHHISAGD